MTATLQPPPPPPATRRRTRARDRAGGPPATGGPARRRAVTTPATMRSLLAALVLLSLAWGAFGGWVAAQHSSAADALGTTNQRLNLDARQMFQSVADADATITAAFVASARPPLAQLQRYENDLATAQGDLSRLQGKAVKPLPVIGDQLSSIHFQHFIRHIKVMVIVRDGDDDLPGIPHFG